MSCRPAYAVYAGRHGRVMVSQWVRQGYDKIEEMVLVGYMIHIPNGSSYKEGRDDLLQSL